ncbi:MAG: sensor histidine kinase [Dehalogenimonas sp.]|uniref:histidine kinase n=1 Tax=Candidatus Dehalogenimonas loeffleri TaxID=3127115 RepID=A0ABZ2J4S0_9CHLR|nr:sensor histidine kinase [Dehalogenimonas sp.]
MTGASGEVTAGHLYEMKRLEWLFIGARWLWVPAIFLLAWMQKPSSDIPIISIGLITASVNAAAMVFNLRIKTPKSQQILGTSMLVIDSLVAWVLILLFVSDFYTAAYAGFLFVAMEGSIRYGLKGSLVMAAAFAVGLLGAYIFRDAVYGVRFSYTGYTFWALLVFLVAVPMGLIVDEGQRQRRRSETYLKEKTLLEERQRIARDMHDNVLKTLHGLSLEATVLERRLGDNTESSVKDTISYIGEVCQQTSREIREVILDLRNEPGNVGIGAIISSILDRWSVRTDIKIEFELIGEDRIVADATAHQLRNIISEALTNVERHAEASRVAATLTLTHDSLSLVIHDNGHGFGEGAREPDVNIAAGRLGLAGMKERVSLMGGSFQLESAGRGTRLIIILPLNRETSDEPN